MQPLLQLSNAYNIHTMSLLRKDHTLNDNNVLKWFSGINFLIINK